MKKNEKNDWLRTLYIEAWKQYSHEDNISQSRNNLFLAVQAALIAILTGISGVLIRMEPINISSYKINLGIGILGFIIVFFAFFVHRILLHWRSVTKAGQAFLNLRWVTARAIEQEADIDGLATIEEGWYKYSKSNPDSEYHTPFPEYESLRKIQIPTKKKIGGWLSILKVIKVVEQIWFFLLGMVGFL